MGEPEQPNELPIACTLGAGEFATRQTELAALGRSSLISVAHPEGGPAVLSFKSDPKTRAELERIVAAEAQCCAFLQLTVATGKGLELRIDGPADAAPVIDDLVEAFAKEAAA